MAWLCVYCFAVSFVVLAAAMQPAPAPAPAAAQPAPEEPAPEADEPAPEEPPTVPEQDVYVLRLIKEQMDLRVAAERAKYTQLCSKLTGVFDATQAIYEVTFNRLDMVEDLQAQYPAVDIENTPLDELLMIEPDIQNSRYYHMRLLEDFFSEELLDEVRAHVRAAAPKPAMKMDDDDEP